MGILESNPKFYEVFQIDPMVAKTFLIVLNTWIGEGFTFFQIVSLIKEKIPAPELQSFLFYHVGVWIGQQRLKIEQLRDVI